MSVQLPPPHREGNVEFDKNPCTTWRVRASQLGMVTAIVSNPHLQAIEAIWIHLEGCPQPQVLRTYDHHSC